jgi:hypothetical protein
MKYIWRVNARLVIQRATGPLQAWHSIDAAIIMRKFGAIALLLGGAQADVYMQYPPGSNNRLEEGGGNRNNNNRLMDTQNNAKGGYGYGGDAGNQAAPVTYMQGSKLSMVWTSQHSCGSENAECQIVLQYM